MDPVTKIEHKFAWYIYPVQACINVLEVIIVSVATVQPIVRITTARYSIFVRKVDQFRNALNVVRYVKIGPFIHDVSAQTEFQTRG